MRRLILLRHGKAELAALTGGDSDRPLAERGRLEAGLTAVWLAGAGFSPDLALVSPSLRTRATWDAASPAFPGVPHRLETGLYLGDADLILDAAAAEEGAEMVMVVGHNPGLQELGLQLAVDSRAPQPQIARIADGFPTATACVFDMDGRRGAGLAAVYEPPAQAGAAPRWVFVGPPAGAGA